MASFSYDNIRISGIACAVPTKSVDTMDYIGVFDEKDLKKFIRNTGVKSKFDRSENQTTSDLCYSAAVNLINNKNIDTQSIDAIVLVTQTPDYIQPATSHVLHKRLGLKTDCMAYDINLGCSGYVYGLQMCAAMMNSSDVKRILLLSGEILRKHPGEMTKDDLLFGNAGTATLIERGNKSLRCILKSDGDRYSDLIIRAGGIRHPYGAENEETDGVPRMDGASVFEFSILRVPEIAKEFFDKYNTSIDDYDYIVLHQANLFMLKHIAKKVGVPMDKVPISIDRYGNTSSASIPLAIVDLCANKNVSGILNLLVSGFGIGLSWGMADFCVDTKDILPMIYTDEYYTEAY